MFKKWTMSTKSARLKCLDHGHVPKKNNFKSLSPIFVRWKLNKKNRNIETPCLAQRRCVERQLHGGTMQGVPTITGGEEAAQLALRGPAAVLLDAAQQGVAEAVLWIGTRFLGPGDFWVIFGIPVSWVDLGR